MLKNDLTITHSITYCIENKTKRIKKSKIKKSLKPVDFVVFIQYHITVLTNIINGVIS